MPFLEHLAQDLSCVPPSDPNGRGDILYKLFSKTQRLHNMPEGMVWYGNCNMVTCNGIFPIAKLIDEEGYVTLKDANKN